MIKLTFLYLIVFSIRNFALSQKCGGLIQGKYDEVGYLSHLDYPTGESCEWTIKGEHPFDTIVIGFTKLFNLAKGDFVAAKNSAGESLFKYDGPQKVELSHTFNKHGQSTKNPIQFTFNSVSNRWPPTGFGFTLNYKVIPIVFKQFGEVCSNEAALCDPYKMLRCQEGQCLCHLSANQMIYSEASQECISSLKAQCSFPQGILNGEGVSSKCAQGTECIKGICECDPEDYFEIFDGVCEPKGEMGALCNHTIECNHNNSLTCVLETQRCGCGPLEGRVIDRQGVKCIGQLYRDCVKGLCIENSECIINKCQCKSGFTESSGGECLRNYGEACSLDAPCSDLQFSCIDGFCACKNSFREIYDKEKMKCLSKLYGECEKDENCLSNMICGVKGGSNPMRHCVCSEGLIPDHEGNCNLPFGEHCNVSSPSCDTLPNLKCVNGECSCPDSMLTYSPEDRKCLGAAGAICQDDEDCIEGNQCLKEWQTLRYGHCEEVSEFEIEEKALSSEESFDSLIDNFNNNSSSEVNETYFDESQLLWSQSKSGSFKFPFSSLYEYFILYTILKYGI